MITPTTQCNDRYEPSLRMTVHIHWMIESEFLGKKFCIGCGREEEWPEGKQRVERDQLLRIISSNQV